MSRSARERHGGRRKRRRGADPPIEGLAVTAQRMAVLLEAGVAPGVAWQELARVTTKDPVMAAVGEAARTGESVAAAIAAGAAEAGADAAAGGWRAFGAAWFVASEAGSPLADCLRQLAAAFRDLGQTERDVAVALAGPTATARLVSVLPVIGVAFGMLLGFDTLRVLFTTPIGWGCVVVGGALMALARLWNRALVRRASRRDPAPGLGVDLLAMSLAGGGSVELGRNLVDRAADLFGLARLDAALVDDTVTLSRRAGAPVAELLRAEAEQLRRRARADGQAAAARLAVRLMLPLSMCVLPAFMVLAVVPLFVAILSSTVGRL